MMHRRYEYCRYWGRASLPPTASNVSHVVYVMRTSYSRYRPATVYIYLGLNIYRPIYMIILCFLFGQEFFSSRPQYGILGLEVLGHIASFERRLRGKAPTPLALPFPFCTST